MPLTALTGRLHEKRCKWRDGPFGFAWYAILYAIEAPAVSKIKIGRTLDVDKRFGSLAAMSPVPLVLRGHLWMPDDTEFIAHEFLDAHRSHGEWFDMHQTVKEFTALIAAKRAVELASALNMDGLVDQPKQPAFEPPPRYIYGHKIR
jgi:hypothetical protein